MAKINFRKQGKSLIRVIIILIAAGLISGGFYYLKKQIPGAPEITGKNLNLPKVIYGLKKMVLVPGGTFSFYMDETPVTYEDFQKYVTADGTKPKYWDYETYNQPENPVTGVDWYQAIDFCNWRSKIEGFSPDYNNGYRLPTEAEFEYAARGGLVDKAFPWGDNFDSSLANYDDEKGIMEGDWWRLAKVKDTPPNNYGLYGMSGNVWQWTNDWYTFEHTKVLKGGSWGSIDPIYLRVTERSYTTPSNYNYDIGFRCVKSVKEQQSINSAPDLNLKVPYEFYQYKTIYSDNPIQIDVYSEEFINLLSQFIADYYPNSIYFQTKIDEQEIINPKQMAELIVELTKEYNINPLFLTGIMVAESGFGSVSFPRWYNNPMAFHWQNALMKNGLPVYERDSSRNQKFKNLKDGFIAFAEGIRKDVYFNAGTKNLDTFHLIYVGYRADEWMHTISKIYKDVLGIRLEPNYPSENVGKLIYTDWSF